MRAVTFCHMSLTGRTFSRAHWTRLRPWVSRLAAVVLLGSILSLPSGVEATPGTDDYPTRLKIAAQDALVDPWNFYNRECTSFVAWRLNNDNGIPFHNYYLGAHWGDASNWKAAAVAVGIQVDDTPNRGAVAWWAAGSPGSSRGHVAWVQRVGTSSIVIEEYNYLSRGRYDSRTIQRSSSLWPSGFIHVGRAATLKNTARPTINGTAQVGQRLTAEKGTWSMTGLDISYQWLADGVPIDGADTKGYRLGKDQRGAKIQVRVTATKTGQRVVRASSTPTPKTAPGVFTREAGPTISGVAKVGQPLTATPGTWSPRATFKYQWFAGDTRIPGATASTYTPSPMRIGKTISVQVTATREAYRNSAASSASTAKVVPGTFENSVEPSIQGVPQVGVRLTADPGVWTPSGNYAYQWFADGVAIRKATHPTLIPRAAQLGKALTIRVDVTRKGYTAATATSDASTDVAPGGFLHTREPKIDGVVRVGAPLTADPGDWSPKARFTYRWLADGVVIPGATGATFTPTPARLHQHLTLEVTARRHGYLTAVVLTDPTGAVRLGRITNTVAPAVSGGAIFGRTLHATPGEWSVDDVTVTYQWLRDGNAIPGATERTYTTRRIDRGHDLRVVVTAVADGYRAKSRQSAAVRILFGRITIVDRPTISGSPTVGSKLVAQAGRSRPSDVKVTYQWYRDDRAIAGATHRRYEPVSRDVGMRLYVVVTVAAPDWASASRRSLRTHAVSAD